MDPLCHHHRYGYIFRSSRYTYLFYVPLSLSRDFSELSSVKKINNYIANFTKVNPYQSFLLKSVKIIDFSLNIKIHSKSFSLNFIEIKPNDLLVSVS